MLAHYDAHFANFAAKVILGLRAFCGEMEKFAKEVFAELPGGDGKLRLRYSTIIPEEVDNLEEAEELLRNRLASDQDHDILQGVTHTGPHRDDFHLYIGDRSLRMYGSQGQVKSAVLALKLATMEVIRSKQGYYPVLLLDDITSELDAVRLNYFLEWILSRGQIFLTTTGLDNFSREMRGMAKIFKIVRGGVTVEKKADVDESLVDLPADAGVAESVENR
jgi:DNA replication and repair protein RecF